QNLNALHSAPLDYSLWQARDQKSPIASRLYEFLSLNFHSGTPVLHINYANLAQMLPIRPERHLSLARKQMDPALALLTAAGLLTSANWEESTDGLARLRFRRGSRLAVSTPRATGKATFAGACSSR